MKTLTFENEKLIDYMKPFQQIMKNSRINRKGITILYNRPLDKISLKEEIEKTFDKDLESYSISNLNIVEDQ